MGDLLYLKRATVLLSDTRRRAVCGPKKQVITISTIANALVRIQEREAAGELITGPKKIGCYGASYLYPVFLQLGIIHLPPDGQLNFYSL